MTFISKEHEQLSRWAWQARWLAYLRGEFTTNAVGCCVRDTDGNIWSGANIELAFRRGLHAEVVALSQLATVGAGSIELAAILVAAERESFTPCGDCMDWVFQLGGPDVKVYAESKPGHLVMCTTAGAIMPMYPR